MSDQAPMPMPSMESILRRDRDKLIGEVARLTADVERLRAALQEIADDPGGYPAENAFNDIQEVAREALNTPKKLDTYRW